MRNISLKFAKVIDEVNRICNKEFGISPNVNELFIKGVAPGGLISRRIFQSNSRKHYE